MARSKTPSWQPLRFTPKQDPVPGVWLARTRYWDDDSMRHDIKRSGRTKGAADRAVRQAIKAVECQPVVTTKAVTLTVSALTAKWLESRKPAPLMLDAATQAGTTPTAGLRMQTWESYEGTLRHHVLPVLGELLVVDLTTPDCEKAIYGMYNKEAGIGYRTAAMARQVLQQVMDYAVRQGYRHDSPVRSVSRVPEPRPTPKCMSPRTVKAVHDAVRQRQLEPGVGGPKPTSRLANVILLLAATGMRIGEALAIRWEDVDVASKPIMMTVSGTLVEKKKAFFRQGYPKSSSGYRTFQQTDDWICEMVLRRYENRQEMSTNAVFATRNGTFVRPSNLRDDLKRALSAADVTEKITPHDFRRTVATGVSDHFTDKASSLQLRHSAPETTRRHYIERATLVPNFSSGLTHMAPGEHVRAKKHDGQAEAVADGLNENGVSQGTG